MNVLDYICYPLGKFLYFIYSLVHDYGFSIIIFTIIVKLVLLPLTVKQYRSSAKMQEIQPLIQEVQRRYKDDKEKLNQELMKVYQEHGYNPAGGCLPLIVQMPIIISLYWVIVEPLKFMLLKNTAQIAKITEVAASFDPLVKKMANAVNQKELLALNYFFDHQDQLAQTGGALKANELINFNFLGFLHLGKQPTYDIATIQSNPGVYIPLLIIPILAVISTFISTKLSMPNMKNSQSGGAGAMASSMTNSMLYIGPIMTLIFSFQLPAGVSLYWSVGYIFTIFQQMYINKHVIKKNIPAEVKKPKEVQAAKEEKALPEAGETKADTSGTEKKPAGKGGNSPKGGNNSKGGSKKKSKRS